MDRYIFLMLRYKTIFVKQIQQLQPHLEVLVEIKE